MSLKGSDTTMLLPMSLPLSVDLGIRHSTNHKADQVPTLLQSPSTVSLSPLQKNCFFSVPPEKKSGPNNCVW